MQFRKIVPLMSGLLVMSVGLAACGHSETKTKHPTSTVAKVAKATKQTVTKADVKNAKKLLINQKQWHYNATNKVYYQVGVKYGTKTTSSTYESMGIFIPAKYVNAKASGQKTYTITFNNKAKVKGYTAKTAPIVMPVNTPGYAAQTAPTGYDSSANKYTKAGFIYVAAGCRGLSQSDKSNGSSPWGVTDLKAAVRTLRLNRSRIAGNTNRVFTFGHSGGGAQSALMGATGDSKKYTTYLKAIGAPLATTTGKSTSDAVAGAMAWCPITSLDTVNEAYEWNMGQYSNSGTRKQGTWTKALSNDMATSYAQYINKLGLKDANGKTLTLKKSTSGIYTSGTYATYLKKEVEQSLNNFLKDTTFPYKATSNEGPSGAASQTLTSGKMPSGSKPSGTAKSGSKPSGSAPSGTATNSSSTSGETYKTATAYIKALNKNGKWITYNAKKNTATITSVKAFVKHCKTASKDVGAFDGLTRQQTENKLFATNGSSANHFDATISKLLTTNQSKYAKLKNYKASYAKAYRSDLKKTDAQGSSIQKRMNLYNPLYYLTSYYDGYNTSKVAKYWRIRTGINQSDTALTVETNLALTLKQNSQVKSVDFATVWGQGHTEAERKGNNETNFIKWVNKSLK
ncbi:subtype A tannase [Lactiplantibacillus plantarum]|uniref:subtype A tannase n=1 Tax=Lactiplantibacillus plantarum TaxID=1590 RepID=UPI0006D9B6F8|nr:subtype A tannase [Lactiplantibacillus plantarum]MBJ7524634.1 tannase [Lactobacillus sp. CRM56-2]ARO09541.1 tannase [Lactiplantibacillus plantarum]AYF24459.1 tannase [Lactiplantibacillus plantarum]MEC5116836.1 subtype A tannase [Lactiplantibacillus plantarum]QGQ37644.1 tannase [Lactiplantibacillus plantarum]